MYCDTDKNGYLVQRKNIIFKKKKLSTYSVSAVSMSLSKDFSGRLLRGVCMAYVHRNRKTLRSVKALSVHCEYQARFVPVNSHQWFARSLE